VVRIVSEIDRSAGPICAEELLRALKNRDPLTLERDPLLRRQMVGELNRLMVQLGGDLFHDEAPEPDWSN